MKFHCDHCKTRYSISDERVDGKILKIRCKNCSEIIRVSKTKLDDDALGAQAPLGLGEELEDEWYVAIDGNQSGPFNLEGAKSWIRERPRDIDIHCWCEGFDQWKLTEHVSHFKGLRENVPERVPSALPFGDGDQPLDQSDESDNEWSQNISTRIDHGGQSALDAVEALDREAMSARQDPAASVPPDPSAEASGKSLFSQADALSDGLDFDIGEASRVVQLPDMLNRMRSMPSGGIASAHSASAIGAMDGTGAEGAAVLGNDMAEAAPEEKEKKGIILWLLGGAAVAGIAAVLFFIVQGTGDNDGEIARGNLGGGDNLGFQYQTPGGKKTGSITEPAASADRPQRSVKSRRPTKRSTRNTQNNNQANTRTSSQSSTSSDEVSLGGERVPKGPLDGSDLVKAYKKNQFTVKRCYERALKSDPFLKVRKTDVKIQVSPSGKVSSVNIPSLSGTPLGKCLESSVRRWRFRPSTETFNGQFPVVFGP